jgi:hypothetical protein
VPSLIDEGFGWFTPVDLALLFRALPKLLNPESVVLVGGQALAFWVDQLDIPRPELETPALTQDADFFATRTDAEHLARILGAEVTLATMDHVTPNTATIQLIGSSGQRLLIDCLSMLIGLRNADIQRLAVPFTNDDQALRVLHPILCLESRFHNLHRLSAKRHKNGIAQAKVAVKVAEAYIASVQGQGQRRLARRAAARILRLARSQAGLFVYAEWGIDALLAVIPQNFENDPDLRNRWWPHQCEIVTGKRTRHKKMQAQKPPRGR